MTPKELFLKNDKLVDQLSAVTRSQWFQAALVSVRAQLMQLPINQEGLKGALLYEATLLDLPEQLPDEAEFPDAGRLQHDLDQPRANPEVDKKKPKTKK